MRKSTLYMLRCLLLLCFFLLFSGNCFSKQDASLENLSVPFFIIDGYVKLDSAYNLNYKTPEYLDADWKGLSKLRSECEIALEYKFHEHFKTFISSRASYDAAYSLKGRHEFTSDVLDNYEKELAVREIYIQGAVSKKLDIKIGRQIVAWGKSDNIRITDVLNPIDLREPGLTDTKNLRLPVFMSKLDYSLESYTITGIAIHEMAADTLPSYGSDFFYFPGEIQEDIPSSRPEHTEFAISMTRIFEAWDFSLYFADIYNDQAHWEIPSDMLLKHARLKMAGAAFSMTRNHITLIGEAAHLDGFKITIPPDYKCTRTDVLLGIAYTGIQNTVISIDVALRHIHEFHNIPDYLQVYEEENRFQSVIKFTRHLLNDRLSAELFASIFGKTGDDGIIQRFSIEYKITDALKISTGFVFYKSGDLPELSNIGNNDRLFINATYRF